MTAAEAKRQGEAVAEMVPVREEVAALTPAPDAESLLRLAIEHGAPVESLERLMKIRRELKEEAAKEAYNAALSGFQGECPAITKRKEVMNKDGASVRYRYAPFGDIIAQIKPLLEKWSLSHSEDAKVIAEPDQVAWVKASCTVKHVDGHSETTSFQVPVDREAYMTAPQQFASALTFAKRYAFCNGLGIVTADEDDDAGTAGPRPQQTPCPKCGAVGTVRPGKEEYGGGWFCWKKKGGCGATFPDDPSGAAQAERTEDFAERTADWNADLQDENTKALFEGGAAAEAEPPAEGPDPKALSDRVKKWKKGSKSRDHWELAFPGATVNACPHVEALHWSWYIEARTEFLKIVKLNPKLREIFYRDKEIPFLRLTDGKPMTEDDWDHPIPEGTAEAIRGWGDQALKVWAKRVSSG